jgi:hypothetical protein
MKIMGICLLSAVTLNALHAEDPKYIIVDNAVIVKPLELNNIANTKMLCGQLCHEFTLSDAAYFPSISSTLETDYFDFLNNIPVKNHLNNIEVSESTASKQPEAYYKGKKVAPIVAQWITNKITSETAISHVLEQVKKIQAPTSWFGSTASTKKKLFKNLTYMTFNPGQASSLFVPNTPIIDLLKVCKKNGYTLILASNWNSQHFKQLYDAKTLNTHYKILFESKDNIQLSPSIKSPSFYQTLLKKYEITDPSHSIALEAELTYAKHATECGLSAFTSDNIEALKKQLIKLGALPAEES